MAFLIVKKIIRSSSGSNVHTAVDLYLEKSYKYEILLSRQLNYLFYVILISVLFKAGDNHHFHPTCARCAKCGDPFGDGEEMYLQGNRIMIFIIIIVNYFTLNSIFKLM